ncbi:MAG: hypothetical protein CM15mP63_5180 [Gammaproteobacteria bacterium]|nr:MAG: hypothetical protein CM15mP63_5180 [Gammaproteobacteria bacterium]
MPLSHILSLPYTRTLGFRGKIVESKSIFETNINEKLKINLKAFYWLNNIFKKIP